MLFVKITKKDCKNVCQIIAVTASVKRNRISDSLIIIIPGIANAKSYLINMSLRKPSQLFWHQLEQLLKLLAMHQQIIVQTQ
jgi:hypothetical protein